MVLGVGCQGKDIFCFKPFAVNEKGQQSEGELQVRMEKDFKMVSPEEQLRNEQVLRLKKSRDKGVLDVFERLSCGSWMQHIQYIIQKQSPRLEQNLYHYRGQEAQVGGKQENLDRPPLLLEVEAIGHLCKWGALLGGTLGSSSKSKNSWESSP